MRRLWFIFLLGGILALCGCGRVATTITPSATPAPTIPIPTQTIPTTTRDAPTAAPQATTVVTTLPVNQPFDIRVGQQVRVGDTLTVTFDRVDKDSRCPKGVACVWAGAVTSVITIQQDGHNQTSVSLSYPGIPDSPDHADYMGMRIQFLSVAPAATAQGSAIPPENYVIKLLVTPNESMSPATDMRT